MQQSVINLVRSYFKNRLIKKIFVKFFLLITEYKLIENKIIKGEILILYASDRSSRLDHINSLKSIALKLNFDIDSASFVNISRVVKIDACFIFNNIYCDIESIYIKQAESISSRVNLEGYRTLLVHCDTVPIQSYFVNLANALSIETYTLQHGFYPHPKTSEQWLTEYSNSISKNFFVWNLKTEQYFINNSPARNYINSGPFTTRKIEVVNNQKKKNIFKIFFTIIILKKI